MSQANYLSLLNDEQRRAVMHEGRGLLILAGAGSGKTRVITSKIAYLIDEKGVRPKNILAVTFTKKAANEMRERAKRLSEGAEFAHIKTFHSFGAWFLRLFGEQIALDAHFTVYDDDDMVTLIAKTVPSLTRVECARLAHKIARAKDYCLSPDDDLSLIDDDPVFASVYQKYEARLRETGNVDFGDLILLPLKMLQNNDLLREELHSRFKVILVDEYQDSNVAQFELLKMLVGQNTYVCVVGDDDQSIYSFRGAEVQNILTFQNSFLGTDLIKLTKNYRSVLPILHSADAVVSHNQNRLGKNLESVRGDGKKPVLVFLANQDEETAFCAKLIQKAHASGCPYSDWAVLYRTNAQSLSFETEFLNARIPYHVVGSLKFYEREEIKDLLAYIGFLLNPCDEVRFSRIVNKPARGIGLSTMQKIIDYARSLYTAQAVNNFANGATATIDENGAGKIDDAAGVASTDGVHGADNFDDANNFQKPTLLTACYQLKKTLPKKAREGLNAFLEIIETLQEEIGGIKPYNALANEALATDALNGTSASKDAPKQNLSEFITKISKLSGLIEYHTAQDEVAGTQRCANMAELANSAVLYPKTSDALTLFMEHIELDRTMSGDTDEVDAVTLITIHNTKGLEFPRVIITGIEQGVFPREDKTGIDLEEERRLFYVGITRAQDELYLTSARMRRLYGHTKWMEPSIFLRELKISQLDLLGKAPASFGATSNYGATGNFTGANKFSAGAKNYLQGAGLAPVASTNDEDELASKWQVGLRIYHDDFGYGVISRNCYDENGDFVITVHFETGAHKKFMPEYQSSSLMLIKNDDDVVPF